MSKNPKKTQERSERFKQEKQGMRLLKNYLGHKSWSFQNQVRSRINATFTKGLAKYDGDTDKNLSEMIRKIQEELEINPENLTCVYCGSPANCCDHLISPSQGGTNQIANLAPCCTRCNQSKGKMSWQEFLKRKKNMSEQDPRFKKLARYTEGYTPEGSFASPEILAEIQAIFAAVYPLLQKADALMKQAVEEHEKSLNQEPQS